MYRAPSENQISKYCFYLVKSINVKEIMSAMKVVRKEIPAIKGNTSDFYCESVLNKRLHRLSKHWKCVWVTDID